MSVTVIDLAPAHLPAAAALEQLCFSLPWSQQSLQGELENPLAVMLAAVDVAGALLGWAGLQAVCGEGSVTNVAVHPEARRQGIGRALTCALIERAQALGLSSLTLEVRPSNEGAVALYRLLGFAELGRRPGFYERPREDALMMRLDL